MLGDTLVVVLGGFALAFVAVLADPWRRADLVRWWRSRTTGSAPAPPQPASAQPAPPAQPAPAPAPPALQPADFWAVRVRPLPPRPRTPKPDAPTLDFEVPTRNAAYRAELEQMAMLADQNLDYPLAIIGPPGVGKHALLRRYLARLQHHGYLTEPPIEVTCTGRPWVDGPALVGQGALVPLVESPDALPGALRAAGLGVVVLHHPERMSRDAQYGLYDFGVPHARLIMPVGTGQPAPADARLISICPEPELFPEDYREEAKSTLMMFEIRVPSLKERPEDIEPNLDYLLQCVDNRHESKTTFGRGAREHYLQFAQSPFAVWADGFRDLAASVERLIVAAKATGGVIGLDAVKAEVARLGSIWADEDPEAPAVESDEKAEMLRKYLARYGLTFDEIKKSQMN